jgi:HAD superfamily hydrolase (TIGR01509 family)
VNIKAAIYDMDGTLVDSLMLWDRLWDHFGNLYLQGAAFRPETVDDKFVRTVPLKEAMERIHHRYGFGADGAELLREANDMMRRFYAEEVCLKDGVLQWLEYCKAKGVRMCIASATAPELVEVALEHCGIGGYFEKLFSCTVLGKGKEHPDVFLLARDYLGAGADDTWVFEDSLVALQTAVRAGFKTVGIYDQFNFGQDEIRTLVDEYIGPGESITRLI